MITLLDIVLRSRTAASVLAIAAVLGGIFIWHKVDKSNAVRRAREGYVTRAELTSTRAQLEELKRRQTVADAARGHFNSEVQKARAEAEAAEQELQHYVSTVEDSCGVRSGLIERLHNR